MLCQGFYEIKLSKYGNRTRKNARASATHAGRLPAKARPKARGQARGSPRAPIGTGYAAHWRKVIPSKAPAAVSRLAHRSDANPRARRKGAERRASRAGVVQRCPGEKDGPAPRLGGAVSRTDDAPFLPNAPRAAGFMTVPRHFLPHSTGYGVARRKPNTQREGSA